MITLAELFFELLPFVISSPEHFVLKVSFCYTLSSVVRRPSVRQQLQTSSPQKPMAQLLPNFTKYIPLMCASKVISEKWVGQIVLLPWQRGSKSLKINLKSMDGPILILFSPKCFSIDSLQKLYKSF